MFMSWSLFNMTPQGVALYSVGSGKAVKHFSAQKKVGE